MNGRTGGRFDGLDGAALLAAQQAEAAAIVARASAQPAPRPGQRRRPQRDRHGLRLIAGGAR